MAEEHAELFKIGVGQVRQNVPVDAVVVERRFVLAKPETFEPTPTTVTFPSGPALIIIRIGWPVHDRAIRSHNEARAHLRKRMRADDDVREHFSVYCLCEKQNLCYRSHVAGFERRARAVVEGVGRKFCRGVAATL
jgi:hypothetical protein